MPEDTQTPAPTEPVVAETTPQVVTTPQPATQQPAVSGKKFGKKKLTLIGLVAAVLVVVIGAGAGAYFGVIAPNKPENVLKTAAEKFLKDRPNSAKVKLSLDMKQQSAELKNVTVNFTSSEDRAKKAFTINIEAAASGVKLPVELRGIEDNIYFKVGDLGSVKTVAALAGSPEASALIDTIDKKVSNQWIEVDQSLLKQANLSCVTDSVSSSLSQKDVEDVMKLYSENAFVNIKSSSKDTVDGVKMTKFDLGFDESKAEAFGKKIETIEGFKKAAECGDAADGATGDREIKKDEEPAPKVSLQVWVDGDKNIKKMEIKASDDEATGTATVNFSNQSVNITKPEGAKPLLEVLGDFSQLFGGGLGGSSPLGTGGTDDVTDECLAAYQAFVASNGATALPANCQE